jgi:hypothetical protein
MEMESLGDFPPKIIRLKLGSDVFHNKCCQNLLIPSPYISLETRISRSLISQKESGIY